MMNNNELKNFVNGMVKTTMVARIEEVGFTLDDLKKLNLDEDFAMECYIVRKDILLKATKENISLSDIGNMIDKGAKEFINNSLNDYLYTIDIKIDIQLPKIAPVELRGGLRNGSRAGIELFRF